MADSPETMRVTLADLKNGFTLQTGHRYKIVIVAELAHNWTITGAEL